MTDHAELPPNRAAAGGSIRCRSCSGSAVAVGVCAAGVAITAGPSVGQAGAILLVLLAAAGMVLFFWMSRGAGRKHGAFPGARRDRGGGAARQAATSSRSIEALDEAALDHGPRISRRSPANARLHRHRRSSGRAGRKRSPADDEPLVRRGPDAVGADVPSCRKRRSRARRGARNCRRRRSLDGDKPCALRSERRPDAGRLRAVALARTRRRRAGAPGDDDGAAALPR